LLTTALPQGTAIGHDSKRGTNDSAADRQTMMGIVSPFYLWLDFETADADHHYFDREDDTLVADDDDDDDDDDDQASNVNTDWLIGDVKKDGAEGIPGNIGKYRDGSDSGHSNDAPSAPLIDWSDALGGVGLPFMPVGSTTLGKHGPNLLDYDYLTSTKMPGRRDD